MNQLPWRRWASQALAIVRLELKKSAASRRAVALYLLASLQLALIVTHVFAYMRGWTHCDGGKDAMIFAGIFQLFYLRGVVFFGSVVIFLNLFRGELMDKTLHLYFLAPVRREVLVAGKFLAGVVLTGAVFGGTAVVSYLVMCQHMRTTPSAASVPWALSHTWAYFGVTVLACLGYGAVFLVLGMLFRNPIVPAITVLVWESLIVFFPPLLKKVSVIFYLQGLCPVRVPFGDKAPLFAIPADAPPAWLAIAGLLLLTAAVLTLAAWRVRRLEINYSSE
jgi:ABC-type transport system involved in multi-copper enzyme maturation permease subunit